MTRPARGTAGPNLDVHFSSEDLDHSLYSPDFSPNDVYVFRQEAALVFASPAIKRQGSWGHVADKTDNVRYIRPGWTDFTDAVTQPSRWLY
jgi:hypothetical protein